MKRTALAAAIALAALSLHAYDLTDTGFTLAGQKTEDGKTMTILADESGAQLLFEAESEPDSQRLVALHALVAEIGSWAGFEAAELRAVNLADRLQVTVIPRSFVVDGIELDQAVPGGVQIFYKTATEYDFKVKSGKYLVRVSSVFTGFAEMSAAALAAYKDPAAFIATRDPLYVQRRLEELSDRADAAEARIAAIEALDAEFASYKAKAETALLAALNGAKPIKEDALAKLVELKTADPTLDKKNAPKALKAEGITLSAAEISAIYLLVFGER